MRSSQALLFATLAAVVKAAPQGYATPNNTHPSIDDCKYHGVNNGTFDYDAVSYRESGARNTLDWRIWLLYKCNPISFWHDVPLYPFPGNTSIINLVVEIPRWTDGKIELESSEPLAPIFHDERKGSPRFVESVYPHKSYPFVYGSIPQTWENPNLRHPFVNEPGDADPIDFFDIGLDTGFPGQIKQSKVLGGLAPNDGGETDWKILTIDINDPLAPFVNNFEDLEKYRPGMLDDFYAWFTYYKVARGSDVISITGNAYQNASFIVEEVLPQGHKWWQDLIAGKEESELDIAQTSFSELGSYIAAEETYERFGVPATDNILPAAAKPSQYNSWYFLNDELELIQQGEN